MPKAHLNGFLPFDDGTVVTVFAASDFGRANATPLWSGAPDAHGMVQFEVGRSLRGRSIRVVAVGGRAQYYAADVKVSPLGAFHTASLQLDRVQHPESTNLGAPPDWLSSSQGTIHALYRAARYRNIFLTAVFAFVTIASPFVGLLLEGLPGLAAGSALSIASMLLGDYETGFSRGI